MTSIINIESSTRHWTETIRRGSAHILQSSTAQPRQAKRMKFRRSPDALAMDNKVCLFTSTTSFDARGLMFTVVLSKSYTKDFRKNTFSHGNFIKRGFMREKGLDILGKSSQFYLLSTMLEWFTSAVKLTKIVAIAWSLLSQRRTFSG
ncbi:hypothetical protein PC117_g4162 [Phytophthora cactorum]|uniref:Uncharacterized protein n=1 Tax=Phytophthora cactorum TaxID=29920 RepID=A0A8T1EG73_9STRA|nr:hypothetical protein PC117_g4162 [Phytophthora cactorum]